MKKLGLFLVSLSLFCLAAFNACKGTPDQSNEGSDEMDAIEEVEAMDTAAVEESEMDTTMIDEEAAE